MTLAYRIIRSEHYEIDLVMRCLDNLAIALSKEAWTADFGFLFLLLDYVENFPATFHHPKEEDYLFEAVRRRSPDSSDLLDTLCREHAAVTESIRELRLSLETHIDRPAARGWFCDTARKLARLEREHMRKEERTVLPLALQVLSKADWEQTNAAFVQNDNPFLTARRRKNFDQLFSLILRQLPAAAVLDRRRVRVA
jgi:hemerythrin-like domain-containing protein|tara:strand:- start:432 stop:1022 length:591 start_codon:yes stop_codon:yes gene_type:complete